MAQGLTLGDPDLGDRLKKSDTLDKVGFEATVQRGVQTVFKKDDSFVIWGPASVEIVDKEGDKITVEALDKALPQLLRRARLSLEHTDQIVGRILRSFKTEDSVKVNIDGNVYERSEFPTDVLDLDDGEPPALYVAGEVYDDTEQSMRAREQIEAGDLTSYSISGEALVTQKQIEDGNVYDDIVDMDLSAVTLCQEGMNQGAKYARIQGDVEEIETAGPGSVDKNDRPTVPVLDTPTVTGVDSNETAAVSKQMSDSQEAGQNSEASISEAVAKELPDEDLATVKYVESLVDERLEQFKAEHEETGVPGGVNSEGYADAPDETTGPDGADGEMSMDSADASVSSTYDKQEEAFAELAEEYPNLSEKEIRDLLENASEGADGDDDITASDESDQRAKMSKNVREARDTIAEQLGVPKSEANQAINRLLTVDTKGDEEHDYEDEDEEMPDEMVEEMDDDEEHDYEDEEHDYEDKGDDEEMPEEEMPEDEMEEDDEPEGDMEMSVDELERQLPEDVWKVVSEYVGESESSSKAEKSPTDILEQSGSDEKDELDKAVQSVLEGGAEVNGANAVPTEKEDQGPSFETGDDDEETSSPALNQFYGE